MHAFAYRESIVWEQHPEFPNFVAKQSLLEGQKSETEATWHRV